MPRIKGGRVAKGRERREKIATFWRQAGLQHLLPGVGLSDTDKMPVCTVHKNHMKPHLNLGAPNITRTVNQLRPSMQICKNPGVIYSLFSRVSIFLLQACGSWRQKSSLSCLRKIEVCFYQPLSILFPRQGLLT